VLLVCAQPDRRTPYQQPFLNHIKLHQHVPMPQDVDDWESALRDHLGRGEPGEAVPGVEGGGEGPDMQAFVDMLRSQAKFVP